jgi:hypothetical protein
LKKRTGPPGGKKLSFTAGFGSVRAKSRRSESFFAARRPGSFFSKKEALPSLI